MSKQAVLPLLIILILSTTTLLLLSPSFSSTKSISDCPIFHCPTSDSYPDTCLENVIPPWPICKFKSVEDWVAHAEDSATRCCGDDMSQCKCPKKDTDKFLDSIGSWCDGVRTCGEEGGDLNAGDAFAAIVSDDEAEEDYHEDKSGGGESFDGLSRDEVTSEY